MQQWWSQGLYGRELILKRTSPSASYESIMKQSDKRVQHKKLLEKYNRASKRNSNLKVELTHLLLDNLSLPPTEQILKLQSKVSNNNNKLKKLLTTLTRVGNLKFIKDNIRLTNKNVDDITLKIHKILHLVDANDKPLSVDQLNNTKGLIEHIRHYCAIPTNFKFTEDALEWLQQTIIEDLIKHKHNDLLKITNEALNMTTKKQKIIEDKLLAKVKRGYTIEKACLLVDVSPKTVKNMMDSSNSFKSKMYAATMELRDLALDVIVDDIINNNSVQSAKWLLNNKYSSEYSTSVNANIEIETVAPPKLIEIVATMIDEDEQPKQLEDQSK